MGQSRGPETRQFSVTSDGDRLDKYLAGACPDLSRSQIQKLIRTGDVRVNGTIVRPSARLKKQDLVEVTITPAGPVVIVPEEIPFEVVYESKDIIVIDKPAGLTVYPGAGHTSHTLVNALLKRFPDLEVFGNSLRPGIVHRLDKDTSGLMVIARNETARQDLINQFKLRSVVKGYMVLVRGKLMPGTGAIEASLGRDPANRQRMAVVSSGRPARTDYRVVKYIQGCSLIEAFISTGRTHQIRVHFAAIGFPIVGDAVYGFKTDLLHRQFLHSFYLRFKPPGSTEPLTFKSDLPEDLKTVLHRLTLRSA